MCIDTVYCKYGWLTAVDRTNQDIWQANRRGLMRDGHETSHRHELKELLKPVAIFR